MYIYMSLSKHTYLCIGISMCTGFFKSDDFTKIGSDFELRRSPDPYRVAKIHRMPELEGHLSHKSH